jgi:hypothetical protein
MDSIALEMVQTYGLVSWGQPIMPVILAGLFLSAPLLVREVFEQ